MRNHIGNIIYAARQEQDLTQDQYGAKYEVSGPAVFKFEKGYVRPSLKLWVRMAFDAGLSEHRAILVWLKAKLPEQYQDLIEFQGAAALAGEAKSSRKKLTDYATIKDRDRIRSAAADDASLPRGLKEFISDSELWALFKPTGSEINALRDIFGPLGNGNKHQYREALRVLREFIEG